MTTFCPPSAAAPLPHEVPGRELFVHLDESAVISPHDDEGNANHDWDFDWAFSPRVLEFDGNPSSQFVPATIDNDAASTCSTDVSDNDQHQEPLCVEQSQVRAIHDGHLPAGSSSCYYQLSHYATDQSTCTRPEYLFAKAFKKTPETLSGIYMKRKRNAVYISKIAPDGLFARSNLRVGDQIISVNGVSCRGVKAARVAQLIKDAKSSVSIMAHNAGGNATLVSSSVQKLEQSDRVGVCFRNKHGALVISKVNSTGLLGDSLIMSGDRCMLINGTMTTIANPHEAARIISDAPDFVTIVSRPNEASAMVLACENLVWWSRAAVGLGIAAGAVHHVCSSS